MACKACIACMDIKGNDEFVDYRGIPNYDYKRGKITFIRTSRQANGTGNVIDTFLLIAIRRSKNRYDYLIWNTIMIILFGINNRWWLALLSLFVSNFGIDVILL